MNSTSDYKYHKSRSLDPILKNFKSRSLDPILKSFNPIHIFKTHSFGIPFSILSSYLCLAITEAVSSRLSTAAVRVQTRLKSCRICGGQSGTGAVFIQELWSHLRIFIPPIAPQSSVSAGAGTVGQTVAAVPSGLSLTP
jgi:hypothetical protein